MSREELSWLSDEQARQAALRDPLRSSGGQHVSAAATSVVTVTSITFSVLLLAVQQTASALTPVVFDQFLRRTANQVYFGFFVGLSVYSFLILAMGRQNPAPVYGAALTLLLIVVAMRVLLLLFHGRIDQ